jgi:putative transcriptional regulator
MPAMKLGRSVAVILVGMLGAFATLAHAQQGKQHEPDAVILVASPGLRDADYRQSVVIVVPVENDRHIGVIVNRPTRRTLSSLFPEHQPSKKVTEPVFFGGPMSRGAVVAVVKSEKDPGKGTVGLTKDMFLAMTVNIVDKVIEDTPNDARYYVGYIVWRPGELRSEIDRKVWNVVNASPDVVFRKDTTNLWEELSRMARAITASLDANLVPGMSPATAQP